MAASTPAHADAAAGRQAYEKGDYRQAMVEWQAAADKNDPEAEFGLGSLYESGAGDLKQDYKRAVYWYQKAADQGSTGAEYRLALLFSTGGDNFPSDLVEAYKWASLAAQSQGVWGTLAADFKSQLDKVMSPGDQAAGKKRAAALTEARAAKKDEAVAAVLAPAPPIGPVGKPTTTGCPGWPFPTLPCTDQFPPLAGTQAPPRPTQPGTSTQPGPTQPAVASPPPHAAKPPIEELSAALAQIDCAALHGRASPQGAAIISGTVPDAEAKAKLVQLAGQFFPTARPEIAVDIVPPPLCRSLAELNVMRIAGLATEGGGLTVRLNNGSPFLREGDPIKIEVHGPAYPVNLRIDYFSLDGHVLHLKPDGEEPAPKLAAGSTRLFGNPANGEVWNAGGAPFGTELITVIGTPVALELGASRPQVEKAVDYLRDLKHALDHAGSGSGTPNLLATLLVKTSRR